ncbi:hypothetical protein [Vibrio parahaemolyticus]|uniref:hypothetical protein n=1 Tax=Vibrio parahaemolyticus TaxID=670 RepID=UPI001A8DB365|nr:hypothetical protein [Vibrio parahaemolyticus]MBO0236537.1 hypothetical protein [Vibrio parahaemolyticus]
MTTKENIKQETAYEKMDLRFETNDLNNSLLFTNNKYNALKQKATPRTKYKQFTITFVDASEKLTTPA